MIFPRILMVTAVHAPPFGIAVLLVFDSSVISYRYTLRFCLESIQARPRRRFLIHHAHNPKRLYIHRLSYPLIPASHLHGQGYITHSTLISHSLPQLTPCISCVHLLLFCPALARALKSPHHFKVSAKAEDTRGRGVLYRIIVAYTRAAPIAINHVQLTAKCL